MKNPVWPYRALTREAYILTILALSDPRLPHTVAALGPRVSWCAVVSSGLAAGRIWPYWPLAAPCGDRNYGVRLSGLEIPLASKGTGTKRPFASSNMDTVAFSG